MTRFTSCPHECAQLGLTSARQVSRWTVARRLLAVVGVILMAALAHAWQRAARRSNTGSGVDLASVHRSLIRACGIRVEVTGEAGRFAAPGEPVLVVGNHVSWLDVMALSWVQPLTLVAKEEVGRIPVIGTLARATGTIFIDRENLRQVEATRRSVAARLRAGHVVAAFPEATTTCGRGLGPMFPAMFQAAIDVGVPVQPVTFTFSDVTGLTTAGSYVGEQSLLESVRTIVGRRDLTLRIQLLPRIAPPPARVDAPDKAHARKALRTTTTLRISRALDPEVGNWHEHRRSVECRAWPTARHIYAATEAAVALGAARRGVPAAERRPRAGSHLGPR